MRELKFPKVARFWVGLIVIVGVSSGVATAGQMEDALAAFDRGDEATATRLLRPLAKLGSTFAEAMLLRLGDFEATLRLAQQDDAIAQFHLGRMLSRGEGAPRDYVQAHVWLNLAAAKGNAEAAKDRDAIARLMTSEQLARAQRLVRLWKPVR